MSRRFYHPEQLMPGPAALTGSEARHLAVVMRAQPGMEVELFDGAGRTATAAVVRATAGRVELVVNDLRETPSRTRRLVVAAAPPKGERLGWLVEKLAELGVDEFVPLLTERTVVDPGAGKIAKLRQTVIEAAKQSGSPFLMQIAEPIAWPLFLAALPAESLLFVAQPGGGSPSPWPAAAQQLTVAIGPEGGWTPNEMSAAEQRGAHPISLGSTILRVETAGIVAAGYYLLNRK